MGWTYCGECAVKKSEAGMFVNPARWGGQDQWHVLAVGGRTEPALTDRDTIEHALAVLDRESAAMVFQDEKMCAGDAALREWLAACDTPENAAKLFNHVEMYPYALYYNSIYTQQCMLAWYKNLAGRENQRVHDAVNQITIAVGRLESSRREVDKLGKKKATEKHVAACREHIEFILQYRRRPARLAGGDLCILTKKSALKFTAKFSCETTRKTRFSPGKPPANAHVNKL